MDIVMGQKFNIVHHDYITTPKDVIYFPGYKTLYFFQTIIYFEVIKTLPKFPDNRRNKVVVRSTLGKH